MTSISERLVSWCCCLRAATSGGKEYPKRLVAEAVTRVPPSAPSGPAADRNFFFYRAFASPELSSAVAAGRFDDQRRVHHQQPGQAAAGQVLRVPGESAPLSPLCAPVSSRPPRRTMRPSSATSARRSRSSPSATTSCATSWRAARGATARGSCTGACAPTSPPAAAARTPPPRQPPARG